MNASKVRKERTCKKCGQALRGTAAELRAHTCPGTETYRLFPVLADKLPKLVRQQRILAAKIAPLKPLEKDDKAVRDDIDALLVEAGLQRGDKVTCLGYDVIHNERDGQERIKRDLLVVQLALLDLAPDVIDSVVTNSTVIGWPSAFATVEASVRAKVRAA